MKTGIGKVGQASCLSTRLRMTGKMPVLLCVLSLLVCCRLWADVTVTASVDQRQVSFGDSFVFTISVRGAQGAQPKVPTVDGLRFDGPSTEMSTTIVNNQINQSLNFKYAVTPSRMGEFTIPAIQVDVGGKQLFTEPVQVTIVKNATEEQWKNSLFARVRFEPKKMYLGQVAPLDVYLYAREDVPLRGVGGFQYNAEGLGYRFGQNLKQGKQVINGERFNVYVLEGAVTPEKTGSLPFGPCAMQTQLRIERKGANADPFFAPFFGTAEYKDVPVVTDEIVIEVLPLPAEGRPPEFAGAVGQWKLEVTAKPTEVAVGDPITLTIKISGDGNIDTVPLPKFDLGDDFKTYDPTTKTTKNDLNTAGERIFEQVLVARDATVKQLPEIRLAYFDPIAGSYVVRRHEATPLLVKSGSGTGPTIVGGGPAPRPKEKLGEDIVYLKGDLGTAIAKPPLVGSAAFWVWNAVPVLAFVGAVTWKRRTDRLRGDVAYARRSRAAKQARKLLTEAKSFDDLQRIMQNYLGNRLNIPESGITASVVTEHLEPRGVDGALGNRVRGIFETCDSARFAGGGTGTGVDALRSEVERVIDELERNQSASTKANVSSSLGTALVLLLLGSFSSLASTGEDFKMANQLYDAGKFAEASALYEKIEPKTAHVFFNLGNAHYRESQVGKAILCYERARRLAPRDPDILANLKFAQEKLGVDAANRPASAAQRIAEQVFHSRTLNEWIGQEIAALWVSLLSVALAIWTRSARAICIGVTIVASLWLSFALTAIGYQMREDQAAPKAILIAKQTEARFAPLADSTVHFKLTEGTRVSIREDRGAWLYVERADGQDGWVKSDTLERVNVM